MALTSSAQVANTAAPGRARRPAAATSSSLTRLLPSVFKRAEISEFAGLKSTSSCITYVRHVRENNLSLFDAVASQVVAKAGNSGGVRGETVAKMRVAINGFGRIGRNFMRRWHSDKGSSLEIVAINDLIGVKNAAHLLQYDSIMGKFEAEVTGVYVSSKGNDDSMYVDGKKIVVLSKKELLEKKEPSQNEESLEKIWKDLDVQLVIEATGKFTKRKDALNHIKAGAKKVIITSPVKAEEGEEVIPTYVMGINAKNYIPDKKKAKEAKAAAAHKAATEAKAAAEAKPADEDLKKAAKDAEDAAAKATAEATAEPTVAEAPGEIISNGSATINCLAPLISTLHKAFDIEKGTVAATLSYTSDQSLLDAIHCDIRRSRAAALNIVPTNIDLSISTLCQVLSDLNLEKKLDGLAMCVPTPNVSVVDLVVNVKKKQVTATEVNEVLEAASKDSLKGILEVCKRELVSMDFRGNTASAIVDAKLTKVVGGDMIKVVAWFDNEWAYSQRVLEFANIVGNPYVFGTDGKPCTVNSDEAGCKVYDY